MNKAQVSAVGILFFTGFVFVGCSTRASDRQVRAGTSNLDAAQPAPVVVNVLEVKPSTTPGETEFMIPAALSVNNTALVLAEREGRILQLHGEEGMRIAKGAVLATFGDEEQQNQLRQAEFEVSRSKVEEQQYEAVIRLNRSEFERIQVLAKDGVASRSDIERAQYKLDQSTYEYEKTRLATRSAQAKIEAVKLALDKSVVRAPIAGVITHRYVALGTSVAKNDKLFEISQLSPLEVKFQLPQTERVKLSPGQIVHLSLVNDDRPIAQARVRRVDPVGDAASNTIGYLADIIQGTGLMPGLAVNVRLRRATVGEGFWLPRAAFPVGAEVSAGLTSALWVVSGDRCEERVVTIKAVEGDQVEIVAGLAVGDRVIVAPLAQLKHGIAVAVKTE